MSLSGTLASCLVAASMVHHVPAEDLVGIMVVEGGRPGLESPNTNGTKDLGIWQINTIWVPERAAAWGVDYGTAYKLIRDDPCINVTVAAYVLRKGTDEAGSRLGGVARYHSANPKFGIPYLLKFLQALKRLKSGAA